MARRPLRSSRQSRRLSSRKQPHRKQVAPRRIPSKKNSSRTQPVSKRRKKPTRTTNYTASEVKEKMNELKLDTKNIETTVYNYLKNDADKPHIYKRTKSKTKTKTPLQKLRQFEKNKGIPVSLRHISNATRGRRTSDSIRHRRRYFGSKPKTRTKRSRKKLSCHKKGKILSRKGSYCVKRRRRYTHKSKKGSGSRTRPSQRESISGAVKTLKFP